MSNVLNAVVRLLTEAGEPGLCSFCETSADRCRQRSPVYCCKNCCHPLLEVVAGSAAPTGDDDG